MTFALTWLAAVLRDAGLDVIEEAGWETRGRGDVGPTLGVLCHDTVGPKNGNMPSLGTLIHGRSDLVGPLAQLGLGRDGTFYVIAGGRANHAGVGSWHGITTGNTNLIGIEAENTGYTEGPNADVWPEVQMDAYARGVAAILKHCKLPVDRCAGHKEYCLPPGRKIDPTFDMNLFRVRVGAHMEPPAAQQPAKPVTPPLVAEAALACHISIVKDGKTFSTKTTLTPEAA